MENAVFIGLSRQMAMRRQMDVIANNLANVNTASYRSETMLFEEYLLSGDKGRKDSFVLDQRLLRSTKAGPIQQTGNDFDVAINGSGYLVVDTPAGRRFTRNGHFNLDRQGQLSTIDGHPVLDTANQPIRLDPQGGRVTIAPDGSITNANGAVARLAVVSFSNDQDLRKVGDNLYVTEQAEQPAAEAQILQGSVEGSNVEPIVEMTKMIDLSRGYQGIQKVLDSEQERQRRSIERLAKIA